MYIEQMKHEKNIRNNVMKNRLGPAGFWGTDAPCSTVVTGMASCSFALAACNFCDAAENVWYFIVFSLFKASNLAFAVSFIISSEFGEMQ